MALLGNMKGYLLIVTPRPVKKKEKMSFHTVSYEGRIKKKI